MMFQWEEPRDAPWSSNLEKSFSSLGCDVWVARIMTITAEQYVGEWIEGLSENEQSDAELLTAARSTIFSGQEMSPPPAPDF